MSFSKAKLKRFNDIEICNSPSAAGSQFSGGHPERKEQIEKFIKDNMKSASKDKEKDKEMKSATKLKGLRLFRTPSLPHRLRFRQNSDITSNNTVSKQQQKDDGSTVQKPPPPITPLKGKEALHYDIRQKTEQIETLNGQIDKLNKQFENLKSIETQLRTENTDLKENIDKMEKTIADYKENEERFEEKIQILENEMKILIQTQNNDNSVLKNLNCDLEMKNKMLNKNIEKLLDEHSNMNKEFETLTAKIENMKTVLEKTELTNREHVESLNALRLKNEGLEDELTNLKKQIELDALTYAEEVTQCRSICESLRNNKNTLEKQLAESSELITNMKEEIQDKNIELDEFGDIIKGLYIDKMKYEQMERSLALANEKMCIIDLQAGQKIKQLESDLEHAIEREQCQWQTELNKCQNKAKNELVQIELEKRDMKVLLENANDLIRERDEKIQKYEQQMINGIDYYVKLSENLEQQIAELKQDCARTMTEKYNYQLTLNNTRSTVNILMERLKKSDSDVEIMKQELETLNMEKEELENRYKMLETEKSKLQISLDENVNALIALKNSSKALQNEMNERESIYISILGSEEETIEQVKQITDLFQKNADLNINKYVNMYNDLKVEHENRETYIADMKKALDEFARVIELARIELDYKNTELIKVQNENETLKLENISLKSKIDNNAAVDNKENRLNNIKEIFRDSELKAECDQWLLTPNGNNKRLIDENTKSENIFTPKKMPLTPIKQTTPRTPRTPKTPRSLKKCIFAGKENQLQTLDVMKSPQMNILKPRNF